MRVVLLRILASDEEAIEYILEAIRKAGYEPGKDFVLAMDAASSEWKGEKKGEYILPKCWQQLHLCRTGSALEEACAKNIRSISIEDGLDEEDWEGWQITDQRTGRQGTAGRR